MAWSIVGVGTSVEVTAATHTLTVPAGVSAGDLLVACIASRIASTTSITLPSGGEWTLVSEQKANNILTTGSAVASAMMAYCVRGASDPNLTFTHPAAPAPALGRIVAYRGGATPTASAKDTQTSSTTAISITAVNLTGMTTTVADTLLVAMLAGGQEAAWSVFKSANAPSTASGATDTTTAPSTTTWIERADVQTTTGNDTSLGIFDAVKTATGATGNFTATASVAASHALVAGAFKIYVTPPTADAWSNVDKASSIALSNSDKTATGTLAAHVRSTTTQVNGTAGKHYAEFHASGSVAIGAVGISPTSLAIGSSNASHFTYTSSTGNVQVNSVTVGNLGAGVLGDVFCVAWDAGAELVWWRKNGGLWNNDASADPATGTNGFDCSFAASTPHALWFRSSAASGSQATIRTELAEYTQTVPSGFKSWMGETPLVNRTITADAGSYALSGAAAALVHAVSSTPTTWNPSDKTAGVTLSGGNYEANLGVATGHVRSVATHAASGKYYAELQVGAVAAGIAGAQVGVASATVAFATQDPYANGASFFCGGGGNNAGVFIASDTTSYEIAALTVPSVISIAVDYDNDRVWFRVDGGNWNDSGAASPATNTGGLAYAASDTQALFASNYADNGADVILWTADFPFNYAPPSGFAAWQPLAETAITASGGSYALSGAAASLEYGREVAATGGSYGLSGQPSSLELGREVLAVAGSHSLAGAATTLRYGRKPIAVSGSYAISGAAAGFRRTWWIAANAGAYTLTGHAATFRHTWTATVVSGSYAITGTPANLLKPGSYAIIGLPGSYALSGTVASLEWNREVLALGGSYALTGQVTSLEIGKEILALAGSYALTGQTVSLEYGREVLAVPAAYALTGTVATFRHAWKTSAVAGSYALFGQPTAFARTWEVAAVVGSYALSGLPANLLTVGARAIIGLPGAYALTGAVASLEIGREVLALSGSYALTGVAATLSKIGAGTVLAGEAGSYALAGSPVSLIWSGEVVVTPPGGGGMPWWGHGGHIPKRELRKAVKELLEREEKRKKRRKPKEIAKEIIAAIEPQGLGVAEKRIVTRLISQALLSQLPQMFYSQPLIHDKGELERAILFIIEAAMRRILDEEEDEEAALLLLSAA